MRALCAALLVLAGYSWIVPGFGPSDAFAQSPQLDRVEQLTADGQFASAREALQGWLLADFETAARGDRQRALWLRGLLTVDPEMAAMDFRRLMVEYPGGPFSDGAILRLAYLASARSDYERAGRYAETLLRDYPESPYRDEASAVLTGLAGAPAANELREPSPASATDGAVPPGTSDAAPGLPFTVQLGAFSSRSRANTVAAAAEAGEVEVRLVTVAAGDLVHVRTGAFATRAEAEARAEELRLRGLPALVSTDREDETPIR